MQRHYFSNLGFLGSPPATLEKSVRCNITATLPRLWDPKKEVWGFILLPQLIWKLYELHYYPTKPQLYNSQHTKQEGWMYNTHQNVCAPTNPMAQEDLTPPHFALWDRNPSQPAGNSHRFCRNSFHWTINFLSKLCFDHFIISPIYYYTQKTIALTLFFFKWNLTKLW